GDIQVHDGERRRDERAMNNDERKLLFIQPRENDESVKANDRFIYDMSHLRIVPAYSYLDAYLKSKMLGLETGYLDFRFEPRDGVETIVNRVKSEFDFNVAGIGCLSQHYLNCVEIARMLKTLDKNTTIVLGGHHPTIIPGDFIGLKDNPFDFLIRGDGEIAFYRLLDRLKKKKDSSTRIEPRMIEGTPVDVNEVPLVDLSLYADYLDKIDKSQLPVILSRGCIHDCSFCTSREHTCGLKKYRPLSPKNIEKQLEKFKDCDFEEIFIADPIFGVEGKWFDSTVECLGKMKERHPARVQTHVDLTSKARLEKLVENGIRMMVGLESASPEMLHLMNKTRDPLKYLERASSLIRHAADLNMEVGLNVVLGFPGETRETIDETFEFMGNHADFHSSIHYRQHLFMIFPGTPVYNNLQFFENTFGTRVHCKQWWKEDVDQIIARTIVDPSRNLTHLECNEYLLEKFASLVQSRIVTSRHVASEKKLHYCRQLLRLKKDFQDLRAVTVDLLKKCREMNHERKEGYRTVKEHQGRDSKEP
ncbi:MAG: B12-binding domain-containing radical SAM protein, partial [Candidatus Hodarchaeota archaeon]